MAALREPLHQALIVFLCSRKLQLLPDRYTGVGGNASGGGVNTSASPSTGGLSALGLGGDSSDGGLTSLMGGGPLLSAFSDNAGDGGSALSGAATAEDGSADSATGTATGSGGASYSGAGGNSAGGSVTESGPAGLVQLFSGTIITASLALARYSSINPFLLFRQRR